MPDLEWLAEIVFFGAYFIAWVAGAFDTLTTTSKAHTWIVITAIAALVAAVALLFFNGYAVYNRRNRQAPPQS